MSESQINSQELVYKQVMSIPELNCLSHCNVSALEAFMSITTNETVTGVAQRVSRA